MIVTELRESEVEKHITRIKAALEELRFNAFVQRVAKAKSEYLAEFAKPTGKADPQKD